TAVRGHQLQRLTGELAGVGIVRPQKGRVHRSGGGQTRVVRRSKSRHDFSRRSQFHGAAIADETVARLAGARSPESRRQQKLAGKRARGGRDQRGPYAEAKRRDLSGRSLLSTSSYPD